MNLSPRTRRIATGLACTLLVAAVGFFVLTSARPSNRTLPPHHPDPARGEVLFSVGGCVSCHKASISDGVSGPPAGGVEFPTLVGSFWPGNLTPDVETGLGGGTAEQVVAAMIDGVSPDGRHYFPAFPDPSYRAMPVGDILDLWAHLETLTPVRSPARAPTVPALGLARRGVGLWKRLALEEPGFRRDPRRSDEWNRGAYLSNGPGHCGECHTPRNALMILDPDRAYEGGPHPRGEGLVPGLLNLEKRGRYSDAADLVLALQFGETFGYDRLSSGGMADVQMNLAKLPEDDLLAMAEYLLSLE